MNEIRGHGISLCIILLTIYCSQSFASENQNMPTSKAGEYKSDVGQSGVSQPELNEVKKIYIIGTPNVGFELFGAFQIYNQESDGLTDDQVTLNWYRDGELIPAENKHTYIVKKKDDMHEISFGISKGEDHFMMSDPLYIKNSDDNNYSGIYVSTEIGDSYSSNACPHKSDCDDSSLMYGVGIGYEIGKFAFDFKYNAITPKYRKINSEETSISTSEMYIGMRYKVWDEDNLAVSLGGGLGHWSSLHTGNNSIITGIGTYNQSGISPSLMGDIGYSVNKYIEPYITLRAIKGFSSSENNEYIGTVGIRFRFGETSQLINHNTTIVNNYTQAPGVGYLELDFARNSGAPTAQSIQALSNSFDESFDGCVTIISHASQTGRKKYNEKLSAKRAQFIEDFIVDKSPKIKNKHIFKEYRLGSLFPIYKDNTSNRRAQIFFSENKMWCEK